MARLYEYAVILEAKLDKDGEVVEEADLLVKPTFVLRETAEQVQIEAARAMPGNYSVMMGPTTGTYTSAKLVLNS